MAEEAPTPSREVVEVSMTGYPGIEFLLVRPEYEPNRPHDGDEVCDAWEASKLPFEINYDEGTLVINVICAQHMMRRANGLAAEGYSEHELVERALGLPLVRYRSRKNPRQIGEGVSW